MSSILSSPVCELFLLHRRQMKYLRSVYNHSGLLRGHRAVPVCRAVDLLSNHAQKLYIKLLCIVHLLTKQAGVHLSEKSTKQTTKNPPQNFSIIEVFLSMFSLMLRLIAGRLIFVLLLLLVLLLSIFRAAAGNPDLSLSACPVSTRWAVRVY